ncbi:hypothetical protein DXG03_006249 [Asterophora parasitica]|uniref:Uncharacterized protein n=1 Tax=Asterophora parasitica TaxID=117018 RepID=A0A9P7G9T7_9AGAR|nr:hypothetical protein DXG03_006249 [Asterophora parasitica]
MRRRRFLLLVVVVAAAAIVSLSFAGRWRTSAVFKSSLNATLDELVYRDVVAPRQKSPPSCPNITHLCSSLAGKRVLLIGPQSTYHLHSLWLHALQAHENRYITCYGPAFCNSHHVCRSANLANSSTIRYILSTTLHASPDPKDPAYTLPTIDPSTAVRTNNAFWLRHASHAHVIVINHGPLPAPASTYTGDPFEGGNWSFADALYDDRATAYLNGDRHSRALTIVNAALHATLTKFLPATLRALDALQNLQSSSTPKLLVWHGSWYLQRRCLAAGQSKHAFTVPDLLNPPRNIDPWSLYYNAQGKCIFGCE